MSSTEDPITIYFRDQSQIIDGLYERGELSLAQTAQNIFSKSLVLIAASFLESQLRDIVESAISARTNADTYITTFCRRKGIERQYHTWFDWKTKNANTFFGLFGDDAKARLKSILDTEEDVEKCITDFMFIGSARNEIAHLNILTFPFNETAENVFARIESARGFPKLVERVLLPTTFPSPSAAFPNTPAAS